MTAERDGPPGSGPEPAADDRSTPSAPSVQPPLVRRFDRLDGAILVSLIAFGLYVVATFAIPGWEGDIEAPRLDMSLDTVAAVVVGASAVLAWARYRGRNDPIAAYQAAAFLALAVADITAIAVALAGTTGAGAPDAVTLAERQLFVFTGARIVAGATLVIGGLRVLQGQQPSRPLIETLLPAVVVLAIVAVAGSGIAGLLSGGGFEPDATSALITTPFGAAAQVAGAALALAAAVVCRRLARRDGSIGDAFIAFGLVVAACAQFAEALDPGQHPRDVAAGDVLWLGFGIVLLLGIEAAEAATLRSLRTANRRLEELSDVAAERAALEERARLSRELHDGLAQDLWYAKLKATRLAALPELPVDAAELVTDLAGAIDAGLADSRNAVLALRTEAGAGSTLRQLLERAADDFEDRFGVRTERSVEGEPSWLGVRAQAELLQIARQALRNVGQHADATLVRIETAGTDADFRLSIRDNGRGFEPGEETVGRFGLAGMRERAAMIGGNVEIESKRWGGTRVSVTLPAPGAGGGTAS